MFYDLRQGDSTQLIKAIPDASIDLVVTDPPYFIDGMGDGWDKGKLEASAKRATVIGGLPVGMKFDPDQGRKFQAFMEPLSRELLRVMKPGGYFICFSQPRLYHRLALAVERAGFDLLDTMTWRRRGQAKAFSQDHFIRNRVKKGDLTQTAADALLASIGGRKTPQLGSETELMTFARKQCRACAAAEQRLNQNLDALWNDSVATNVVHSRNGRRDGKTSDNPHMTVKPVDVITHLIRLLSKEGEVVLDPFLGSGSHGVAAIQAGRSFVGFELNDEYFALSQKRIAGARSDGGAIAGELSGTDVKSAA